MKNRKNLFLLALLVVVLAVVVIGCGTSQPADKPAAAAPAPAPEPVNTAEAVTVMPTIMKEFMETGHAVVNMADDSPAKRDACITCHNGVAFEKGAKDMASIDNRVEGTNCMTCHSENGQKLMASESIELKQLGSVSLGSGNLCATCHSGRGKAPDQKSAPHGSVQTDLLVGKSGAGVEGVTSIHASIADSCVYCHTAKDDQGIPNHAFRVTDANINEACGTCHNGLTDVNKTAAGDFDGNGKTEGLQDEVKGLLALLKGAIEEKLVTDGSEYTQFVSSHGSIYFADKDGNHPEEANAPSEAFYNAAWNYMFVEGDGSYGIHNPAYAVKLLQKSYKDITGKDVPNATLK